MPPMIQFPLNLPDVRVISSEMTEDGDFVITVESTLSSTTCRQCGREISDFHAFSDPVRLRHMPIFDHKVYLVIRPKRFRCPTCDGGPTTTQRLAWYELGHATTNDFDRFCLRSLINSTIADTARKLGVCEALVEGVLDRCVRAEVDWNEYERLGVLGLDEIALRKGHRDWVVLVTTRVEGAGVAILAVLADRKKETVAAFLRSIPERLKETVERVCCDMYEGFVRAAQEELPGAKVVVDRFHVARAYSRAADEVRKRETRRLKKALEADEYDEITGAMWAFRKAAAELEDDEYALLERIFGHSPEMEVAYNLREDLREIFERKLSKSGAKRALRAWSKRAVASGIAELAAVVRTLDRMMDEITSYFLGRETSGFVEGFNNRVKVLKRRSYGLSNLRRLFQRLYLDVNGYALFGLT
jgi:transposase